jgi:hypothetical protein
MSAVSKVFISASLGSFVASWAEPKIVARLPDSLKTPTGATITHAVVAGLSAGATYWGLGKLGIVGS